MSLLDQMKLWGLIDLSLILIMTSCSKGSANKNWTVNVKKNIIAKYGSNVTIPCTFTYPVVHHTDNVQLYWKNSEKSRFNTFDNDKNAFVFHTNASFVLERYRGRTSLVGNKVKGNCSLEIQNITQNEGRIYLRIIAKGDNYSFKDDQVSISLAGAGVTQVILNTFDPTGTTTPTFETTTVKAPNTTDIYIAIFVPITAILIIILVTGIVCFIKHKRSQTFTREESGYYANFSRASSSDAKREMSCQTHENKKLPEPKVFDDIYLKATEDPVYINLEAPPGEMGQSMDQMDSVYANVDYSK